MNKPFYQAQRAYIKAYNHPRADRSRMPYWFDLIQWHIQNAMVISTPDAFVLARPVDWSRPDHTDLRIDDHPTPGCWHVSAAAGDFRAILRHARAIGAERVSFERPNTSHVHYVDLRGHLFNRHR